MSRSEARAVHAWTAALVLVGLVVIAATHRDFGITWDEPLQAGYGERVLAHLTQGDDWRTPLGDRAKLHFYGPLFDTAAALLYADAPESRWQIRHALNATVALAGVVAAVRLGAGLGGVWGAVFASLALALLPRFFGHAFNNPKDLPFACFAAWSLLGIWRLASGGTWRAALGCGVAIGLALCARPSGLALLAASFALALGWAFAAGRLDRGLALRSVAVWALAWLGMIAVWPWAHESPLLNPLRAAASAFSFPLVQEQVLFAGQVHASNELPRRYLLQTIAITTPPLLLALAAAGLATAARKVWRAPLDARSLGLALVALCALGPLALPFVSRPNVYGGLRHVLFVLPALAVLAGLGAAWAISLVSGRARVAVLSILALGHLALLPSLIRLHPYQYSYFNAFVGGVAGSESRYQTDYWVASYTEAFDWIHARAAERPGRELQVVVASTNFSFQVAHALAGPGVRVLPSMRFDPASPLPAHVDYYVATTRNDRHQRWADRPIVHRIGRDGATFTVIRGRGSDRVN